ncbi:HAMP domain-containing sensor histidine kinase [Nitratireductor sp. OM-1]|uniref:sensor histidine kinase n=1 Tax=Nitratireductor sp. OM-1 TaxID=1756988 RepID=UPI000DDC5556|nr:HAMP domain-containing sensor histidine kinase [Nitratireductor sp. OM-1]
MSGMQPANSSLWWKLSWQLGVVIFAVIMSVIVGLAFYGSAVLSPNIAVERTVMQAITGSLARNADGQFLIRDNAELRDLKARNPGFWYVAATQDRSFTTHGEIPEAYLQLVPLTYLIRDADIRGSAETEDIASVETASTSSGEIRVLFGGLARTNWVLPAVLAQSWPIYVSLLGIALPTVFIAVPRIVGRSLNGIHEIARKASEIDPQRHGTRLPTTEIPTEIVPLVSAFNASLMRLETAMKKRQRFLIDAAHELRTPIAIVHTRVDGMSEGEERRQLLSDIARLAETAEQLLDFERNDQMPDQDEKVDLVEIAQDVVSNLAPLAIASGYEIAFEREQLSVICKGSPTALPRAIINVVRNSIDHGGGYGLIEVSSASDASITIRDQGPGIPEGHRELVFEPFYRVLPKSRGAGLGLSLVKQIVENHGGHVSLDSSSQGTTVVLRFVRQNE